MPRVFLDSNIWFSAFYGSGNCKVIFEAGKNDKLSIIISQQVLKEVVRNIKEKIPAQLENFKTYIFDNPPEIFSDPKTLSNKLEGLIAVEDLPIFQAAMTAKVDYFVTGNTKDFKIAELEKLTKIKIVTPKQLLEILPFRR